MSQHIFKKRRSVFNMKQYKLDFGDELMLCDYQRLIGNSGLNLDIDDLELLAPERSPFEEIPDLEKQL